MNTILFDQSDYSSDRKSIVLNDYRFEHIRSVLKKSSDETIRVGEREGRMGNASVLSIDEKSITLVPELTEEPPAPLPVTLVVALPRPKSFRKLLHTATVMGVKEIHLIKSWKVDKSYWSTPFLTEKGLDAIILDGLMQTRDTIAPKVHLHKAFKPFVEDLLPGLAAGKEMRLFHPALESATLAVSKDKSYLYLIGPEGGFTPYEVELMKSVGAAVTSLGPRIQRVEQAVASVLGFTSMSLL